MRRYPRTRACRPYNAIIPARTVAVRIGLRSTFSRANNNTSFPYCASRLSDVPTFSRLDDGTTRLGLGPAPGRQDYRVRNVGQNLQGRLDNKNASLGHDTRFRT